MSWVVLGPLVRVAVLTTHLSLSLSYWEMTASSSALGACYLAVAARGIQPRRSVFAGLAIVAFGIAFNPHLNGIGPALLVGVFARDACGGLHRLQSRYPRRRPFRAAVRFVSWRRARYYDPSIGQFLTLDPKAASTLSPYGYVDGNPINRADPSGRGLRAATLQGVAGAHTTPT